MRNFSFFFGIVMALCLAMCAQAETTIDFVDLFPVADQGMNYSTPVYRGQIDEGCLVSGWALSERISDPKPRIWVIGPKAEFDFVSEVREPKVILFRCQPYSFPGAPTQELTIFVNEKQVGKELLLPGDKDYKVTVPQEDVRIGRNQVRFEFSRTTSPHDADPSSPDTRPLAANFATLLILPESFGGKVPAKTSIREESLGREKVLFQEYPSRVAYAVKLPEEPKLQIKCMVPNTVAKSKVDSVTLKILMETEDGSSDTLLEQKIKPVGFSEKPEWVSVSKELEHPGGIARFSFICDASPAGSATRAAVIWSGTITGTPPVPEPVTEPYVKAQSVILISIDTLRSDTLSCYGYDRETTPNIDRFATEGTLFKQCYSHAPSTLPSHATMLTSLYPAVHNGQFLAKTAIRKDVPILAEILGKEGFKSAAVTGGGQLDRVFGIGREFDLYEQIEDDFAQTTDAAKKWLDENGAGPFFLFMHTYETHTPYTPKADYAKMFVSEDYKGPLGLAVDRPDLEYLENTGALTAADTAHTKALYDAEVRYMDKVLGDFIQWLKDKGLYDNVLIVLTSDHGEEFGEHGLVGTHSHSVYEELLHVPMIVKWPGNGPANKKIGQLVCLGDILPTVLDAAGLPPYKEAIGENLRAFAAGKEDGQRLCYSQMEGFMRESITDGRWKAIVNHVLEASSNRGTVARVELFDRASDPREQHNIAEKNSVIADYLTMEIRKIRRGIQFASEGKTDDPSDKVELSEDLQKHLKGLGYAK